MNKTTFAKLYQEINNEKITLNDAVKEVEYFLETLEKAIQIDSKVKFIKKGVFEVKKYKSKIISNPQTRELMCTKPRKELKFKLSKNNNLNLN